MKKIIEICRNAHEHWHGLIYINCLPLIIAGGIPALFLAGTLLMISLYYDEIMESETLQQAVGFALVTLLLAANILFPPLILLNGYLLWSMTQKEMQSNIGHLHKTLNGVKQKFTKTEN